MQRVQASILQLIGSLDPSLSHHIIPQDPDTLAAAAVRWDTLQHLKFAMPFEKVKIDVFLGELTVYRIIQLGILGCHFIFCIWLFQSPDACVAEQSQDPEKGHSLNV